MVFEIFFSFFDPLSLLHIIGSLGTASGAGAAIEFCGPTIEALDMEARTTVCNMAIEAGARAGLIAPDITTWNYLEDRPLAPRGQAWLDAVDHWASLKSDEGASFASEFEIDATEVAPIVSWGTSPEQVVPITGCVPTPGIFNDPVKAESCRKALAYMGLHPGTQMKDIAIDTVFLGSCTNSRLSDLRAAASIVRGNKIAQSVKSAYVVPGSDLSGTILQQSLSLESHINPYVRCTAKADHVLSTLSWPPEVNDEEFALLAAGAFMYLHGLDYVSKLVGVVASAPGSESRAWFLNKLRRVVRAMQERGWDNSFELLEMALYDDEDLVKQSMAVWTKT